MRALPALLVFAVGCGPAVDPAIQGEWLGSTTVTFVGYSPFAYQSRLIVTTDDSRVNVVGACPDGTGLLVATGSGRSADWSGGARCSPVRIEDCPSVALVYTGGHLEMTDDRALYARGIGIANGCGISADVSMTFNGRK